MSAAATGTTTTTSTSRSIQNPTNSSNRRRPIAAVSSVSLWNNGSSRSRLSAMRRHKDDDESAPRHSEQHDTQHQQSVSLTSTSSRHCQQQHAPMTQYNGGDDDGVLVGIPSTHTSTGTDTGTSHAKEERQIGAEGQDPKLSRHWQNQLGCTSTSSESEPSSDHASSSSSDDDDNDHHNHNDGDMLTQAPSTLPTALDCAATTDRFTTQSSNIMRSTAAAPALPPKSSPKYKEEKDDSSTEEDNDSSYHTQDEASTCSSRRRRRSRQRSQSSLPPLRDIFESSSDDDDDDENSVSDGDDDNDGFDSSTVSLQQQQGEPSVGVASRSLTRSPLRKRARPSYVVTSPPVSMDVNVDMDTDLDRRPHMQEATTTVVATVGSPGASKKKSFKMNQKPRRPRPVPPRCGGVKRPLPPPLEDVSNSLPVIDLCSSSENEDDGVDERVVVVKKVTNKNPGGGGTSTSSGEPTKMRDTTTRMDAELERAASLKDGLVEGDASVDFERLFPSEELKKAADSDNDHDLKSAGSFALFHGDSISSDDDFFLQSHPPMITATTTPTLNDSVVQQPPRPTNPSATTPGSENDRDRDEKRMKENLSGITTNEKLQQQQAIIRKRPRTVMELAAQRADPLSNYAQVQEDGIDSGSALASGNKASTDNVMNMNGSGTKMQAVQSSRPPQQARAGISISGDVPRRSRHHSASSMSSTASSSSSNSSDGIIEVEVVKAPHARLNREGEGAAGRPQSNFVSSKKMVEAHDKGHLDRLGNIVGHQPRQKEDLGSPRFLFSLKAREERKTAISLTSESSTSSGQKQKSPAKRDSPPVSTRTKGPLGNVGNGGDMSISAERQDEVARPPLTNPGTPPKQSKCESKRSPLKQNKDTAAGDPSLLKPASPIRISERPLCVARQQDVNTVRPKTLPSLAPPTLPVFGRKLSPSVSVKSPHAISSLDVSDFDSTDDERDLAISRARAVKPTGQSANMIGISSTSAVKAPPLGNSENEAQLPAAESEPTYRTDFSHATTSESSDVDSDFADSATGNNASTFSTSSSSSRNKSQSKKFARKGNGASPSESKKNVKRKAAVASQDAALKPAAARAMSRDHLAAETHAGSPSAVPKAAVASVGAGNVSDCADFIPKLSPEAVGEVDHSIGDQKKVAAAARGDFLYDTNLNESPSTPTTKASASGPIDAFMTSPRDVIYLTSPSNDSMFAVPSDIANASSWEMHAPKTAEDQDCLIMEAIKRSMAPEKQQQMLVFTEEENRMLQTINNGRLLTFEKFVDIVEKVVGYPMDHLETLRFVRAGNTGKKRETQYGRIGWPATKVCVPTVALILYVITALKRHSLFLFDRVHRKYLKPSSFKKATDLLTLGLE
jgi:hypothetical protein